ncbi:AmmeMemoRadiSam system radical SAM enzyme [Comamonadaceae bacterium G21597-S1]|nr:AmmeMemoRadiSam system radical SAM enzyme [Comamonadaceae bacterium G21597-S1]
MTPSSQYPARWWHWLDDGRVQCDLCPRDCRLHEGQRGACFVRARQHDRMVLTTYGRSSGFCIDPIEKKPLNHFYPGSSVLSFGTAGCNLACKFCQNWDITKSRDMDRLMDQASPERIASAAQQAGCKSVAFTYNDPVIFAEYAMDVADACRSRGIHTVAVTAGYLHAQPRREFFAHIDATNVDLKAFSDDFYFKLTGSHLQPVLDTLLYLRRETGVWVEITTLLIPGKNDSDEEITVMSRWIHQQLGADVPLHFSAFHPDHKMQDVPATPKSTLVRAREIARREGLHHVYTGNVHHRAGDTTHCAHCGATLIERDWYRIDRYRVTPDGCCPDCGHVLAGCYGRAAGNFGRRRIPVAIGA